MVEYPKDMNFIQRWAAKTVEDYIKNSIKKGRQQIPEYVNEPEGKRRLTKFKEPQILELSKNHWLVRTIIRTKTDEIINAGGEIKPRYRKKCDNCDKEYENIDVDKCETPGCNSTDFTEPDIEQYKKLDKFIKEPSPERTWEGFIRSTFHYGFALDKYMWEIGQVKTWDTATMSYVKKPGKEVKILDSSTVLPIVDSYGNFGNYEYFCPMCYEEEYKKTKRDPVIDVREYIERGRPIPKCKCGGELKPTYYRQEVNGKVVARWTKGELVAEFPQSIDPMVEGLSSIVPAIKHLYIIDFMDSYNLQVYSGGDVGSLIIFPDSDDVAVQELEQRLRLKIEQAEYQDVITGKASQSLQILTAMVGIESDKEPKRLQLMESLDKLQSLDFYVLYVEKVCGVFGVVPVFTAQQSQGEKGTTLRIGLVVPNSATRSSMKNFCDSFNDRLLPKIGITDWVWEFGKIESKDFMRDAQIKQTNAMAVSLFLGQGFEVEVEADAMNYTVSSEPVNPPQQANSRLAEGKIPQNMDGAPERTNPGGRGSGVPVIEPESDNAES